MEKEREERGSLHLLCMSQNYYFANSSVYKKRNFMHTICNFMHYQISHCLLAHTFDYTIIKYVCIATDCGKITLSIYSLFSLAFFNCMT